MHMYVCRPLNYVRLRWYKKSGVSDVDRTLVIADNIKYEISLYGRVLTVNNPTRRDSATYQCEAVFSRPGVRSATSTVAEAILEVHGQSITSLVMLVLRPVHTGNKVEFNTVDFVEHSTTFLPVCSATT